MKLQLTATISSCIVQINEEQGEEREKRAAFAERENSIKIADRICSETIRKM